MAFESYDPTWLVELAKQQYPTDPWLQDSLAACTKAEKGNDGYGEVVSFLDRMEGKFWQNVILVEPRVGKIALDILIDRRVAGYSVIYMPFASAY